MTYAKFIYRFWWAIPILGPILGLMVSLLVVDDSSTKGQQADLLLTNGKVYVGGSVDDDTVPVFQEAVAIKNGR